VAIAQTRRTHFARKLIDETRLPMTEVALGAGFTSVRRFNSAIRAAFGKSPSELRRAVRINGAAAGGEFLFKLPYRPPFDWSLLIRFLKPRATPGVESVTDDAYRRTVLIGDAPGVIEVRPVEGKSHLVLRARLDSSVGLLDIVERTRRIFDLGADPLEIAGHLRRDPLMKRLVKARPGLRVPGAWDEFELAVRAILGQQVSVKGATTLTRRLVERFGTPLEEPDGGLTHVFPAPETLADADLSGIGLVAARAAAVRELSGAVCDGAVTLDSLTGLDDFCEQMTRLPGIGQWTAQYIAMRALREPDALPASDLGLRRAASDGDKPISETELKQRAEAWRPWRAYAAMHLWMSETKCGTGFQPVKGN
jgi:AraC family transcriptional regulator of adaptative response / DNA-3-methyladenine glycosylase II